METPRLTFGLTTGFELPWARLVAQAWQIESLGFDSLWLTDHFTPLKYEAWAALAGLAALTTRIRVGTLITVTAFRNPALLAKQALTVDHLSGGRLELGLGAGGGGAGRDYTMTGLPVHDTVERVRRFRETLEIVDRLLRGETVTYAGRYHSVAESTLDDLPVQRPRPPLTLAASRPTMLKIAAAYADKCNFGDREQLSGQEAIDTTRARCERLDEACQRRGRDPKALTRSMYRWLIPGKENPFVSADAFTDYVGRYREIGITEFIFRYPPGAEGDGEPPAAFERIATETIPALRAAH